MASSAFCLGCYFIVTSFNRMSRLHSLSKLPRAGWYTLTLFYFLFNCTTVYTCTVWVCFKPRINWRGCQSQYSYIHVTRKLTEGVTSAPVSRLYDCRLCSSPGRYWEIRLWYGRPEPLHGSRCWLVARERRPGVNLCGPRPINVSPKWPRSQWVQRPIGGASVVTDDTLCMEMTRWRTSEKMPWGWNGHFFSESW